MTEPVTHQPMLDVSSPQVTAMMILMSRLISELSAARTQNANDQAEWIAKLYGEALGDLSRLSLTNASPQAGEQFRSAAMDALSFVFRRLAFHTNA